MIRSLLWKGSTRKWVYSERRQLWKGLYSLLEQHPFKEHGVEESKQKVTKVVAILQYEPTYDKTYQMACASSEDSDQPRHPPSLLSLRCALSGRLWTQAFFMRTARTGQTVRMPRLIWVVSGRTCNFVGFVMRWLKWQTIYDLRFVLFQRG